MKIAIIGAGSIGGLIGTHLAAAGKAQVSALARGATLQALRTHGWRVKSSEGLLQARAHASDSAAELGPQDAVIIAVKGPALESLAPTLAPLITPRTLIVPAMNGVPWWFCARTPGFEGRTLRSVDPEGRIAQALPIAQVVGCVVHGSASTPEPGLVDHRMGKGLILGEPFAGGLGAAGHGASANGSPTDCASLEAVDHLCALLRLAGFDATHSPDIRRDIWYKLWGNLTMNPVSALTGATMDRVLQDPQLREFCTQAMLEASRIGERIGCPVGQSPEDRHAITTRLGAVKTSMLQDVEAGRMIELDAIVTAVHEIGTQLQEPMPAIGALLGLTRVMAQQRGLYPD